MGGMGGRNWEQTRRRARLAESVGSARKLSSEMLEGGRPGCVFVLSGAAWGADAALPVNGEFCWHLQGVGGGQDSALRGPFLQPSDLAESGRATLDRWVLKRLINSAGKSCSWGSRASKRLFLHIH